MKPLAVLSATLTACALLAGCASQPVTMSSAISVTGDDLLPAYSRYQQPVAGSAQVVVLRDEGALGTFRPLRIFVDGVEIAKLRPQHKVEFYLPLGSHVLGILPQPKLEDSLVEEAMNLTEVRTYFYRASFSSIGVPQLSATAPTY